MKGNRVVVSRKLLPLLRSEINAKIAGITYIIDPRLTTMDGNSRDVTLDFPASEFNYFCFNKQNKITCWPTSKGEQPLTDRGQWVKEGRQEIKPGRFFLFFASMFRVYDNQGMTIRDEELRDRIIARGAELFASRISGSNEEVNYEISENIESVYETDAHELSHYLLNSCMRSDSGYGCHDYSGFYNTIPGLKIVHKKIAGRLLFRALLWQTKVWHTDDEVTFMDRIYGSEAHNYQLIEHAKENDWAWRQYGSSSIYHRERTIYLKVPLPTKAIEYLENEGAPYMDTMCHLHRDDKGNYFLSNKSDYCINTIQDCSGGTFQIREQCHHCGCSVSCNEPSIQVDGYTLCSTCYENDDVVRDCSECGENHYYTYLKTVNLPNGGGHVEICEECIENMEVYSCYSCGAYHYSEDLIYHAETGRSYCAGCADQWPVCRICKEKHPHDQMYRGRVDKVRVYGVCINCIKKISTTCCVCGDRVSGVLLKQGQVNVHCPACEHGVKVFYAGRLSTKIGIDGITHLLPAVTPPPMVDVEQVVGWDMRNQLQLDYECH